MIDEGWRRNERGMSDVLEEGGASNLISSIMVYGTLPGGRILLLRARTYDTSCTYVGHTVCYDRQVEAGFSSLLLDPYSYHPHENPDRVWRTS